MIRTVHGQKVSKLQEKHEFHFEKGLSQKVRFLFHLDQVLHLNSFKFMKLAVICLLTNIEQTQNYQFPSSGVLLCPLVSM